MPDLYLDRDTLERLMIIGAAKGWCVQRGCTTCGNPEMRRILGERPSRHPEVPTERRVRRICRELAAIDRMRLARRISDNLRLQERMDECRGLSRQPADIGSRMRWCKEAVMWLLHRIWLHYGDQAHQFAFPLLEDTWAGGIYEEMCAHYERLTRQEIRRPRPMDLLRRQGQLI